MDITAEKPTDIEFLKSYDGYSGVQMMMNVGNSTIYVSLSTEQLCSLAEKAARTLMEVIEKEKLS